MFAAKVRDRPEATSGAGDRRPSLERVSKTGSSPSVNLSRLSSRLRVVLHRNDPAIGESSSLHQTADELFAKFNPYAGSGFLHHCLRLYRFADLLLTRSTVAFPRDVAYLVALTHDLGLLCERERGADYLARSWSLLQEAVPLDSLPVQSHILREAVVFNHRVFRPQGLSEAAEIFRKAVWIEHSHGLLRFGLPRDAVAQVFSAYPRANFDLVILDFARRTLRFEPLTLWSKIFFGSSVQELDG